MCDAGATRGERDRPQSSLARHLEAAPGRTAQAFRRCAAAQAHARRVDNKAGSELAARGDGGATDLDRTDRAAFRLDRWTAAAGNGSRDTPAEDQVVVRRIDDSVDVLFGQVALQDVDRQSTRSPGQPVG